MNNNHQRCPHPIFEFEQFYKIKSTLTNIDRQNYLTKKNSTRIKSELPNIKFENLLEKLYSLKNYLKSYMN